jgi:MFS family permease
VPQISSLGRTFSSLRVRNFRLFFVGQLISNSGNWLTTVALTLLVLHRTNSGTAVGALAACQFGPILLLSAWAGLIADRSNKRRLLYLTQSLEMAQSFVLAALAFIPGVPLIVFFLVALGGGCLLAFDNPARRSFVSEMVPPEEITNAVTLYGAMVSLSRVIGPLAAGALIAGFGYGWGFVIDGVSYVVVIGALIMMRGSELRPSRPAPRGPGQIRSGLRYIRQVPELWISFITLLVIGVASYNFTVVIPLFVEHALHGTDTQYTEVYAAFSVGGILGTLAIARRTVVTLRAVISGAAGLGISLLILVVVPDVGWALPATALVGGTSVAYMTATTALAQLRSDRQMIGRVLALQTVLMIGTTPIGGPFLGWLADAVGARAPVLFGGVAALAAAAFAILAGRGHLKTGQPETPTEPATPPANPTPSSSAAAD